MNAEILQLQYPKNVAPATDEAVLKECILEAVEAFGEQRFAESLVEQKTSERKAA